MSGYEIAAGVALTIVWLGCAKALLDALAEGRAAESEGGRPGFVLVMVLVFLAATYGALYGWGWVG